MCLRDITQSPTTVTLYYYWVIEDESQNVYTLKDNSTIRQSQTHDIHTMVSCQNGFNCHKQTKGMKEMLYL